MNHSSRPTTPKPLKILIFLTLVINIFGALGQSFFPSWGLPTPLQMLGISTLSIEHSFLWQLVTYLFVSPAPHGLSFSFLISIAFNAYLLWVIGGMVIERKGIAHFFILYFGTGIIAGLVVAWLELFSHTPLIFSGNSTAVYGILMGWLMLHPNAQMLLFLTIPFKAKWLVMGLIGANILIDLSIGEWLNACAYLVVIIVGYLYAVLAWNTQSPFPSLTKVEKVLIAFSKLFKKKAPSFPYSEAKIYDFRTGKAILKDDEFMDAMLTKISVYGEKSLTWREKWRLRRISKKKNKPS